METVEQGNRQQQEIAALRTAILCASLQAFD